MPETGAGEQSPSGLLEVGGPAGVASLIRDLVSIMREGGVTELDLAVGELSIRLRGKRSAGTAGIVPPQDASPAEIAGGVSEHIITAPMIGTYYAAPSPGARPFVGVGDRVAPGQVVGIIEAMKIMNEIVADAGGEVAAILAANGQPVEYGSPLLALIADSAA